MWPLDGHCCERMNSSNFAVAFTGIYTVTGRCPLQLYDRIGGASPRVAVACALWILAMGTMLSTRTKGRQTISLTKRAEDCCCRRREPLTSAASGYYQNCWESGNLGNLGNLGIWGIWGIWGILGILGIWGFGEFGDLGNLGGIWGIWESGEFGDLGNLRNLGNLRRTCTSASS
jgi:hypothetical protein